MSHRARKTSSLLAATVAVLVPIVGCSDASEDQEVIEGPQTSVSDDSNEVIAPVIVDSADPVTLQVGQSIDVTTADVTKVRSSDNSLLEVSQPTDDGSAKFNAGATAKATGEATLTVYDNETVLYEVDVTIEQ